MQFANFDMKKNCFTLLFGFDFADGGDPGRCRCPMEGPRDRRHQEEGRRVREQAISGRADP